jgi:16S rRNA (guanine1207-N2)-methyltransferase
VPEADELAPMLDCLDALGERGAVDPVLFVNAAADHRLSSSSLADRLLAITPHKARHDALKASDIAVFHEVGARKAAIALLRITRDRAETLGLIAEAISALPDGAPILVSGANDSGIRTVEKAVREHWPISEVRTKRHARCFFFEARRLPIVEQWRAAAAPQDALGFVTQPGLFAHERIDTGTALLIEYLPDDCNGAAADFGCGWGALSVALLNRNSAITSLDVIDVDHRAIEAAAANLRAVHPGTTVNQIWADIATGDVSARTYDVIVMNPPFHASARPDPAIGAAFFRAASKALKPGGVLFAVANRKLPYENEIKKGFRMHAALFEGEGYKIIRAMR